MKKISIWPLRSKIRCAVEPYINCQKCVACRRGKPNCCVNMSVLGVHQDGGMREFFHVPIRKLHPSPKLTLDQLALVETLGIGAHAVARAQLEHGETILVIGAGPLGLSVIQFAKNAGARVIVADINEQRLEFCRKQLGADKIINSATTNVFDALKRLTNGDLPTAVFDATGNLKSMNASFEFPAHGGKLIFVGLLQGDITFNDPNFHRRELTLLASRNALPEDFTRIISLIEAGKIDTRPWITHRAPLDAVPAQFASWTRPDSGVLKAMIEVT